MKRHQIIAIAGLCAILAGCAAPPPRLQAVRDFAADAPQLDAYAELTERFRATYQREKPYLSPQADVREHEIDRQRQAVCDDLIAIHLGVQAYMRALGQLASDKRYNPEDQVKGISTSIKAWPGTGLDDRHVNAYAGIARLLTREAGQDYQDRSLQTLLRDGAVPMQTLLEAMHTLLRYYSKTSDNEAGIVLGMLEMEIPYADSPQDRLLSALAKVQQQSKQAEYSQMGRRYTVAEHSLDTLAQAHRDLLLRLDPPITTTPKE